MLHLRIAPALFLLLAAACGGRERTAARDTSNAVSTAPTRDDFGMPLPAIQAQRVVSLNPTTTEILFTIGAGDRVVGRTHWDQWPEAARRVPELGDGIRPNVEAVIAAKPDLVILYASADNRPAADRLRAMGIPVVAFKFDRIEAFQRVTPLLGRLVGAESQARVVVDSVSATLATVSRETASMPHPTVFMHAWDHPIIAIGGGSFLSELVAIAGGRNIYDSIPAPSAPVGIEDVVRRDPDIIVAGPKAAAELLEDPAWRVVRAVRERRVVSYDTNKVARPSVQLGMAARELQRVLHAPPSGVTP